MNNNLCNVRYAVAFVNKHRAEAEKIANALNVPVENILGLAALESWYGKGPIASDYNNYFSMHAPAPMQIGSEHPHHNPNIKVAKFISFYQSGQSFTARFGNAVRGKSDPVVFAQTLVSIGYNSGNPATGGTAGYAKKLVDIIRVVKIRMECPQ